MSERDTLTVLHEAKRGLSVPTQAEYNQAWRDFQSLQSQLDRYRAALQDIQQCGFVITARDIAREALSDE